MNKEKFGKFPSTLKVTAEKRFGLSISDELALKWKTIVDTGLCLDKIYDSVQNPADRRAFFDDFKNYISRQRDTFELPQPEQLAKYYQKKFTGEVQEQAKESTAQLRNVVQELSPERQERFLRRLDHFRSITEKMREEKDSKRFSRLRRMEASIWIGFFYDVLPDTITQQSQFAQYKTVIDAFARAGNSLDQFKDLFWDYYKKRKVSAKPTPKTEILLLKDTVYETGRMVRGLIKK